MSDEREDGTEIEVEVDRQESTGPSPARDAPDGRRSTRDRSRTESDLADELGRVDLRTTAEGYVEGRVTGLESVDERTVRLEVTLPHDAVVTFDLEKPIPWSREFLLARIVEDVGYDASSIEHLRGETVYLTRADLEEDDEAADWMSASVRAAGDALAASLPPSLAAAVRGDLEEGPEWRLVDPLERPEPVEPSRLASIDETAAVGIVLVGVALAVVGAVVGATGGLALSPAALVAALPGLLLVVLGLAALLASSG